MSSLSLTPAKSMSSVSLTSVRSNSPPPEGPPISTKNYEFHFGVHTITTTKVFIKVYDLQSYTGCREVLESKPFVKSKKISVVVPGDTRLVLVDIQTDQRYAAVAMFKAPFIKLEDIQAQIKNFSDTCKHLSVKTDGEIQLFSKRNITEAWKDFSVKTAGKTVFENTEVDNSDDGIDSPANSRADKKDKGDSKEDSKKT